MVVSSNGELIELDIVYSKNGMVPEPVTANGIGFVFFGQPELVIAAIITNPIIKQQHLSLRFLCW